MNCNNVFNDGPEDGGSWGRAAEESRTLIELNMACLSEHVIVHLGSLSQEYSLTNSDERRGEILAELIKSGLIIPVMEFTRHQATTEMARREKLIAGMQ